MLHVGHFVFDLTPSGSTMQRMNLKETHGRCQCYLELALQGRPLFVKLPTRCLLACSCLKTCAATTTSLSFTHPSTMIRGRMQFHLQEVLKKVQIQVSDQPQRRWDIRNKNTVCGLYSFDYTAPYWLRAQHCAGLSSQLPGCSWGQKWCLSLLVSMSCWDRMQLIYPTATTYWKDRILGRVPESQNMMHYSSCLVLEILWNMGVWKGAVSV